MTRATDRPEPRTASSTVFPFWAPSLYGKKNMGGLDGYAVSCILTLTRSYHPPPLFSALGIPDASRPWRSGHRSPIGVWSPGDVLMKDSESAIKGAAKVERARWIMLLGILDRPAGGPRRDRVDTKAPGHLIPGEIP